MSWSASSDDDEEEEEEAEDEAEAERDDEAVDEDAAVEGMRRKKEDAQSETNKLKPSQNSAQWLNRLLQ